MKTSIDQTYQFKNKKQTLTRWTKIQDPDICYLKRHTKNKVEINCPWKTEIWICYIINQNRICQA